MKDNGTNITCSYNGEVVSYVYNEMASDVRENFEMHIEHCSDCIDALAAVSVSHFEVSEWRRIEFEPLATPVFRLPSQLTMLQRLQGLFGFAPQWLTTAGAMASLLVFAAGWLYIATENTVDNEIATVVENRKRTVDNAQAAAIPEKADSSRSTKDASSDVIEPNQASKLTSDSSLTKKQDTDDKRNAVRTNGVTGTQNGNRPKNVPAAATVSNPRLGDFEEDEDESLRLSDLFEDIDTRD